MLLAVSRRDVALAIALTLALTACAGTTSTPLASGAEPPADCARADADGVIELVADNIAFDAPCMVAPVGEAFSIRFTNNDNGQMHNVAVYTDSSTDNEVIRGEIVTGPADPIDYEVEALDEGDYYFECTVHPNMHGTLYVR